MPRYSGLRASFEKLIELHSFRFSHNIHSKQTKKLDIGCEQLRGNKINPLGL